MIHGHYIGPISKLKDKTAILRFEPGIQGILLAQFDDRSLTDYAFGWHRFPEAEFIVDESEDDDFPPFAQG